MAFDPYDWSKTKLEEFIKKIDKIKGDGLTTSPGDIWSIKKFFILDYCIGGFVPIFRKYFDKWYYIDTHCGTGLIGFKEKELQSERFPGSPLVSAFKAQSNNFSKYYFFDEQQETVDALKKRLDKLKAETSACSYELDTRDFSKTVEFVKQFDGWNGFFIVIDPIGFKEIKWELMQSLLKIKTADIFFTFMTHVIARHRSNVEDGNTFEESLSQFYGNKKWITYSDGSNLMELYKRQIGEFREYVYDIPVYQLGKQITYHIIIATNSRGAGNIVESARKLTKVKTEMIDGGLKVVTGKRDDLTKWFS
ncbi:MAG: three-Cys-motif partner protein TcmP [Nitrosopumilaceae archaeon]